MAAICCRQHHHNQREELKRPPLSGGPLSVVNTGNTTCIRFFCVWCLLSIDTVAKYRAISDNANRPRNSCNGTRKRQHQHEHHNFTCCTRFGRCWAAVEVDLALRQYVKNSRHGCASGVLPPCMSTAYLLFMFIRAGVCTYAVSVVVCLPYVCKPCLGLPRFFGAL